VRPHPAPAIGAAKRPEGRLRVTLGDEIGGAPDPGVLSAELIDLDRALEKLAALDARLADLVSLRLFAGLEFGEIATLRGVSERTVLRDWRKTRAFLLAELEE
jgi:DNA-directed RNA polymerase specialized sigma24 family protein